jgi:hypothetical protein
MGWPTPVRGWFIPGSRAGAGLVPATAPATKPGERAGDCLLKHHLVLVNVLAIDVD